MTVQKVYDTFFHALSPEEEWQVWHARTQEYMRDIQAGGLPREISDPSYSRYYDWISLEILELILPHRRNIQNIIEIGSGSGALSYRLAQELGSSITLVDNSSIALQYATLVASHFAQNSTFIQSSANAMPIDTGTFDFAHSVGMIEHFKRENIIEIIHEIRRVLKKDGLLYVAVPNFFSPEMIAIWRRSGKGSEQWITPHDLRSLLILANFQVKEIGYSSYTFDSPLNRWIPAQMERLIGRNGLGFLVYALAQK